MYDVCNLIHILWNKQNYKLLEVQLQTVICYVQYELITNSEL